MRKLSSVVKNGLWRSLVARFVRDEEAASSNLASPTTKPHLRVRFFVSAPRCAYAAVSVPRRGIARRPVHNSTVPSRLAAAIRQHTRTQGHFRPVPQFRPTNPPVPSRTAAAICQPTRTRRYRADIRRSSAAARLSSSALSSGWTSLRNRMRSLRLSCFAGSGTEYRSYETKQRL